MLGSQTAAGCLAYQPGALTTAEARPSAELPATRLPWGQLLLLVGHCRLVVRVAKARAGAPPEPTEPGDPSRVQDISTGLLGSAESSVRPYIA
jgi:hypothetical protein